MEKITVWAVGTDPRNASHNHIEDGWDTNSHPEPKSDAQKAWKSQNWIKQYAYLSHGQIILRGRKFREQ